MSSFFTRPLSIRFYSVPAKRPEEWLTRYRPELICAEVNEKIPPPLKFSVRWDPNYRWSNDHFWRFITFAMKRNGCGSLRVSVGEDAKPTPKTL